MPTNLDVNTACVSTSARSTRWTRHIADSLSSANLLLGILSAGFALEQRFELSLACLLLGGLCDGLDGAAARRFGGTRFGVLADDIADGVTYGLAPAVAVWSYWGGSEGVGLGLAYLLLTVTRLVHFTLNKTESDPRYFQGVPSTLGGVAVLCALIACDAHPELAAAALGAVAVKLVTFSANYRHAGRWFASLARRNQWLVGASVGALSLAFWVTPVTAASLVLIAVLVFSLWPSVISIRRALEAH